MDVLTDVLRAVRLSGAVFHEVEAHPPWAASAPAAHEIRPRVLPRSPHVMEYHVVVSGQCWAALADAPEAAVRLEAGSVVVFPHGDAHVLSSDRDPAPRSSGQVLRRAMTGDGLPFRFDTQPSGDAVGARLICGFLGCDAAPYNPLVQALPRMLHLADGYADSGGWLGDMIRAAVDEGRAGRVGAPGMVSRLSELIFVEAVRRHMESLPAASTGWFAALADPKLGRALSLIHSEPAHPWSLALLAQRAGVSRTLLSERFTGTVGMAPMTYLGHWRMQLASGLLVDGHASVGQIALAVGYQSEAAFSRAFKRLLGVSPGRWRQVRGVADRGD